MSTNKNKFNAGDRVRCIDDKGMMHITKGEVYRVISVSFTRVVIDTGYKGHAYNRWRFELVNTLTDPLNVWG